MEKVEASNSERTGREREIERGRNSFGEKERKRERGGDGRGVCIASFTCVLQLALLVYPLALRRVYRGRRIVLTTLEL